MLELRLLDDGDVPLVQTWLNKEHVKRWFEIPRLGVTIDDWMDEIKERKGAFHWLTHLMVLCQGRPIGLCQYYRCEDSGEDFGDLPQEGSYGIDYLIGEESHIGKGLGGEMIALLVDRIFSFPDAQRVTADIDEDNKASERALRSCGFTLRDAKRSRYVIEKTEFDKKGGKAAGNGALFAAQVPFRGQCKKDQ